MQPVSPVLTEEFVSSEIVFARNQPEYIPLPAIRNVDGLVYTRWRPSDEEREALAAGADIILLALTFDDQRLQPVRLSVASCDRDVAFLAQEAGLSPR